MRETFKELVYSKSKRSHGTTQEPQAPVDIHTSHRTRQKTQPEAEESTWQEGEADEDTWQKGDVDNDIFCATVERLMIITKFRT
jgi:hypothetical protein